MTALPCIGVLVSVFVPEGTTTTALPCIGILFSTFVPEGTTMIALPSSGFLKSDSTTSAFVFYHAEVPHRGYRLFSKGYTVFFLSEFSEHIQSCFYLPFVGEHFEKGGNILASDVFRNTYPQWLAFIPLLFLV